MLGYAVVMMALLNVGEVCMTADGFVAAHSVPDKCLPLIFQLMRMAVCHETPETAMADRLADALDFCLELPGGSLKILAYFIFLQEVPVAEVDLALQLAQVVGDLLADAPCAAG